MIFDSMKNSAQYEALHPDFAMAFEFIRRASETGLAVGTYELAGRRVYGSVQEYTTKSEAEAAFEAHRKYIDIQYIDTGRERMLLASVDGMTPATPYSDEKDVLFFDEADAPVSAVVSAGEYGIFFPSDVHKPSLSVDAPASVRKILVKIAL